MSRWIGLSGMFIGAVGIFLGFYYLGAEPGRCGVCVACGPDHLLNRGHRTSALVASTSRATSSWWR